MKDRIIVALDTDSPEAALETVTALSGEVGMFKVGMELFPRGGPDLVRRIREAGFDVFLDLKFHDIPNTVAGAVRSAAALGVKFATVHASGGRAMLTAAAESARGTGTTILAVTVLTSLDDADLADVGFSLGAADGGGAPRRPRGFVRGRRGRLLREGSGGRARPRREGGHPRHPRRADAGGRRGGPEAGGDAGRCDPSGRRLHCRRTADHEGDRPGGGGASHCGIDARRLHGRGTAMKDPDAGGEKRPPLKAANGDRSVSRKGISREDRSGSMWVTGRHPVEELLASATQRARKVLLSDAIPKEVRAGFEKRAKDLALPCLTCPRQEWERRTGEREGGGIAAEIAEYVYAEMEEWVSALPETARVFLLDGITDPGNLGAIVRSARAFAFDGVVLPADRSCPVTGAVFRASAGAAAHVPVVQVTNLVRAIERLQEAGFWLYAAEGTEGTELSAFAPAKRTAIVLGSEEKGIRRLARERCDGAVRIPMAPGAESLNVSVAAGIIAYSIRKSLTSPSG